MAPKRVLRRPAAHPRRRPAAAEEGRPVAVPPIVLRQLSLDELQKLGFVRIDAGKYYGRLVQLAGEVQGVGLEGGQAYLDLAVSGTRDEAILRALGSGPDRAVKVHVCGDGCEGRLTGERLVHAEMLTKTRKDEEAWLTNLEAVVPHAEGPDELALIRAEAEDGRGGAGPPNE